MRPERGASPTVVGTHCFLHILSHLGRSRRLPMDVLGRLLQVEAWGAAIDAKFKIFLNNMWKAPGILVQ